MMKARYNWVPYLNTLGEFDIDFSHIIYPCIMFNDWIGLYTYIKFEFTDKTIN